MNSTLYLPRRLSDNNKVYTELELLAASNFIVVLAEPGAGKTALLESLAQQLGTTAKTASVFRFIGQDEIDGPLVIDAFDELAKIDISGIQTLLAIIRNARPTHVILSSRSSEWSEHSNVVFKEFLGCQPLVTRLCMLEDDEQQKIFDHHVPGGHFGQFRNEVARFDLAVLLQNPQFLIMFADAYLESEMKFTDKASIFKKAIDRLARETNAATGGGKAGLSTPMKISIASEVFAKLMLSGAEGVRTNESAEERIYPFIGLLHPNPEVKSILSTRLFKPGHTADHHVPVHRIVVEYCVAQYLVKRVADPTDPLTMQKCLPIIAPNSVVRTELRGALGWMAALGNNSVQDILIKLDPYAVLANGDPSQLPPTSKRLLIVCLKEREDDDPYFRQSDSWRRFSTAGFFDQHVVEEIKPILRNSKGHLRELILELLRSSPAIDQLIGELNQLMLNPLEGSRARVLAVLCLREASDYDHDTALEPLILEATKTSLKVAALYLEGLPSSERTNTLLVKYLKASARLYLGNGGRAEYSFGDKYFLKSLIEKLDAGTVEFLLNELTSNIVCVCGNDSFQCECRNGISRIVGRLLDQYFGRVKPPYDPKRIWEWVRKLNFHNGMTPHDSLAVEVLNSDKTLRHGILSYVFGGLSDPDQILETKSSLFSGQAHCGLHLWKEDCRFLVDLAFYKGNPNLWSCFLTGHRYFDSKDDRGPDSFRRHMREQALAKPEFLRRWVKFNRETELNYRRYRHQNARRMRRNRRRINDRASQRESMMQFYQSERACIESGQHFRSLCHFAVLVLSEPEKIEQKVGDRFLVQTALMNCLDFIKSDIPTLHQLALRQYQNRHHEAKVILFAACLEKLRVEGNLKQVDIQLLRVLRTQLRDGYSAVSNQQMDKMQDEIDSLIFPDPGSAEEFIREYLEPQILTSPHPELWLLDQESFQFLRPMLAIEWLGRYRELDIPTLHTLFKIAVLHSNENELKAIVEQRCSELITDCTFYNEELEDKRTFWLVRAFCFLEDPPVLYLDWLKADKYTLLLLYDQYGRIGQRDKWPVLGAVKIESVLYAFISKWPKVELPTYWGTDSPTEEKAYRFIHELISMLHSTDPTTGIPAVVRLLSDQRFKDFHMELKSILAHLNRNRALSNFEPPTPEEITDWLENDEIVTVEALRKLIIQELERCQSAIDGGEFNTVDRFYGAEGLRLDEDPAKEIISERLNLRLEQRGITVTPEHHLKDSKRSDFTVAKHIAGRRRLLVSEVKGQWHEKLFSAASEQLYKRYSIHPDAEQQGIYLILWFGPHEKVAGRKKHGIRSALELKDCVESQMPIELKGLIDVFVLDVSR